MVCKLFKNNATRLGSFSGALVIFEGRDKHIHLHLQCLRVGGVFTIRNFR
jgi:hypothetical protein